MKKNTIWGTLISVLLLAALAAVLSFSALAEEEGTAQWDETKFGKATWTAVTDATYSVTLHYCDINQTSDSEREIGKYDAGSSTSYSFISDDKTSGIITADNPGYYWITVDTTVSGETTENVYTSDKKAFVKLNAPLNVGWSTSETGIQAKWTPNTGNDTAYGYPSKTKIKYKIVMTYAGSSTYSYTTDTGATFLRMNENLERTRKTGEFTFNVTALSDFAFDSDASSESAVLTYPVEIATPSWFGWGTVSETGKAQWSTVNAASNYVVTFYQAVAQTKTVYYVVDTNGYQKLVDKGYTLQEGETGKDGKPITSTMTTGYKYASMGRSITVSASANIAERLDCDINNVVVRNSGVYFFNVVAKGDNNAIASAPAGFNPDAVKESNGSDMLYTYTGEYYKTSDQQHDALINELKANKNSWFSESCTFEEAVFDLVQTGDVRVDLKDDDIEDDQANLTLNVPIGGTRTLSAERFISEGSDVEASYVPLSWTDTQSGSIVDISPNGDKCIIKGLTAGTVNMVVKAKYSQYSGKKIKIFVYQIPDTISISGRNSFLQGESYQLKLNISPSTASSDPTLYTWGTTDGSVAPVENGKLTITKDELTQDPFEVVISVEHESGLTAYFPIRISSKGIMPARIDIIGSSTVPLKSTLQLSTQVYSTSTISPDSIYVTNTEVTWASSNDKVATVDQNGKVTPKAIGPCTITATSKAYGYEHIVGKKEITVTAEEINLTKLALSGTKTLTVGQTADIKLAMTPANTTVDSSKIIWRVNGGASITTKSELIRTLSATAEGTATVSVYYVDAPTIKSELEVVIKTATNTPETDVGKTEVSTEIKPTAGTGDKKNDYTADVNAAIIDEAITKVFTSAIPLKTTPYVRIKVPVATSAASITVKIPYASVEKIINYYGYRNRGHLVIETSIGIMDIPPYALREIYEDSTYKSTIDFKMVRVVNTNLNDLQQKAVENNKVFEYQIISGGNEISYFGGYSININIPFTLGSSQTGKGAQVYHVDNYGNLDSMSTTYDYTKKTVGFDTTHLSFYMPYYYSASAWDNPFTDVSRNSWYYDSVFYVTDRGLMRGISAERFVPFSYTTRAMVVTILHRLAGTPAPANPNTFVDVQADQWYTDAVLWATEVGLANGYGNNRFGPNDEVTREQLAVMLHNYAKYVDITPKYGWDTPMKYPDSASISSWAKQGAMYCQITNIIGGRPGGGFEPKGVASRCELATMLLRMNEQMEAQKASEAS